MLCVSSLVPPGRLPLFPYPTLAGAIWPLASSDRAVDLWRIKNIKWHYPPHLLPLSVSLSLHAWYPFLYAPLASGDVVCVLPFDMQYIICHVCQSGSQSGRLSVGRLVGRSALAHPGRVAHVGRCCYWQFVFCVCQASLINLHGIYNNKCNCNYNHDTWKFKRKVKNEYNRIDRTRGPRCTHTRTHTSTYIYRWGLTVDMTGPKKTDRQIDSQGDRWTEGLREQRGQSGKRTPKWTMTATENWDGRCIVVVVVVAAATCVA